MMVRWLQGLLFMALTSIGLVDTKPAGDEHQLQLWIHGSDNGYHFELRQAYMPNGKQLRQCVLDTGKTKETRQAAVDEGLAALAAA
jgi:hypothetical protein